jgi:methionine-gamma-lyase
MKSSPKPFDPERALAGARHEFGEHGGVNLSVEASTTFTVLAPEMMPSLFEGRSGPDQGCYLYGRHFNPTVFVLGRQLACLENTEAAYCAASGMAAISTTAMQICAAGEHAVVSDTVYGGTHALFRHFLPRTTGVTATFVDVTDLPAVEAAFRDDTKLLFVETVANPTLQVADLDALADIAHRHGAKLVVDNTFTPMIITPALHGADVVVHSMTKFVNGASDIIAGAICGTAEFIGSLMDLHEGALMLLGPTMDPRMAFEISLRLPHLGLRMREHSARALVFARRLEERGLDVTYPGLASHPHHERLERMMNRGYGHGGVLGLDVGTPERANELLRILQNDERFGYLAVSLGYFDTLMSLSAQSTSSEMSEEDLEQAGIRTSYVRMSIGFTGDLEDRWAQLERALKRVGALPVPAGA